MSRPGSIENIRALSNPTITAKEEEEAARAVQHHLTVPPDKRQSDGGWISTNSSSIDESIDSGNLEGDNNDRRGTAGTEVNFQVVADVLEGPDPSDEGSDGDVNVTSSRKRKTSKKMFFLWSLVFYCAVCCLFFFINTGVLIFTWFRKMHYFIREPDTTSIYEVVPNVFWILFRFLIGSLSHIILSIFTILLLIGVRQTASLVVKHQEKILIWLFILACITEHIMFVGTTNHMGDPATVENGPAKDTLLPRVTEHKPELQKCFQIDMPTLGGGNGTRSQFEINLLRANLKWMVEVSCGTSSITKGSTLPTWKFVLLRILNLERLKGDRQCQELKTKMEEGATRDCRMVQFLDGFIFFWLILDGLGIWFCFALVYLYRKSVVRQSPGRFSFDTSTYQEDMHKLRHLAEAVRKFADKEKATQKRNSVPARDSRPPHLAAPKSLGPPTSSLHRSRKRSSSSPR